MWQAAQKSNTIVIVIEVVGYSTPVDTACREMVTGMISTSFE